MTVAQVREEVDALGVLHQLAKDGDVEARALAWEARDRIVREFLEYCFFLQAWPTAVGLGVPLGALAGEVLRAVKLFDE